MTDPSPGGARWRFPALATAVMCGLMVGWSVPHMPVAAILAGVTASAIVIVSAEVVRRRLNHDRALDDEWRHIADDWRLRHL